MSDKRLHRIIALSNFRSKCGPSRLPSSLTQAVILSEPEPRGEGESKDPDGVSSAMQPQGVLSMLLGENALMLHLCCKHFRDPSVAPSLRSGFRLRAQTRARRLNFDSAPFRVVWEEAFRRRSAQDDRRPAAYFNAHSSNDRREFLR